MKAMDSKKDHFKLWNYSIFTIKFGLTFKRFFIYEYAFKPIGCLLIGQMKAKGAKNCNFQPSDLSKSLFKKAQNAVFYKVNGANNKSGLR